jgi:threonylcarbamoyladenosine tRNA methylthiotransferase MtaB
MNRRYTAREYRAFIERALRRIPDLGLGTDLMVGFPGETDAQFANTLALAGDLPFDYLHVFTFSRRPGTAATRLKQRAPSRTVTARRNALAALSKSKRLASYQRHIGRTLRVLFESQEPNGRWTGLTGSFIRVGAASRENLTNRIGDVLVTGVMDGLAVGELVGELAGMTR